MSSNARRCARELAIEAAERLLAGRVDEQSADKVGELVAGRALDRPVLAQVLVAREDLLDHQIEWPRGLLAQADAIALGIEQTVDVIDAQPVERPAADQLEHEAVGVVEHFRQLHAQAGELVDVEETAIVDVIGRDPEICAARQCCSLDQCVPDGRCPSLKQPTACSTASAHVRPLGREPGQLGLEVVRAPHHVRPMAGQACECVAQSLQFRMRVTEDAVVVRAGRSAACASRRPRPRMIRRRRRSAARARPPPAPGRIVRRERE